MSSSSFYNVKSFSMFDDLIRVQPDNPTKRLNEMLRKGVKLGQLEDFLKESLTQQFSISGEGWKGIRRHIRFCERNGWVFSVDIDDFLSSKDRDRMIIITDFTDPITKMKHAHTEKTSDTRNPSARSTDKRLSEILSAVVKRIAGRVDSLDAVFRFKRTGIEGWLKVEVVAALGDQVVSLNNRGPDMTFTDGLMIELKAATDFNPSYLRDGALKDNVPCMFIGSGENKKGIERLTTMTEIRIVGIEYLSGIHTWAVGCIVPAQDA